MAIQWNPEVHGAILKEARLNEDWTQQDLAIRVGVGQPIVSQWETGKASPTAVQVDAIIAAFGRDVFVSTSVKSEVSLLAGWVRSQREAKGWTRQHLAERAGVSYLTILNIETGKSANPQVRTREKIETAFGQPVPSDIQDSVSDEADVGAPGIGALIDFDPYAMDDLPSVPGIYVLYDISDRAVYVGQGSVIANRIKGHEQKFWYKSPIVYKASYVRVNDSVLRDQIERVMIRFMKSNAVINRQLVDREKGDSE
ncbi:MAG: helix-turn-helix domain-containing protein [Planctomycetota bacterium]|nr:MAG: helix-turn-helix domain-containing protein [Planctomycetota bacterium]